MRIVLSLAAVALLSLACLSLTGCNKSSTSASGEEAKPVDHSAQKPVDSPSKGRQMGKQSEPGEGASGGKTTGN